MKNKLWIYGLTGLYLIFGFNSYSYSQSQDKINQIKAFWKAERAAHEKKLGQAMVYYQQVTAYRLHDDLEQEALLNIGKLYQNKDDAKALFVFAQVTSLYSDTKIELISLYHINEIYKKQQKPFDLILEYKRHIDRLEKQSQTVTNPEEAARAKVQIGRIYYQMLNGAKARQAFGDVTARFSQTTAAAAAYYNIGLLHGEIDNFTETVNMFYVIETGYKYYPYLNEVLFRRALFLSLNNDYDKTLSAAFNYINQFPFDRYTPDAYTIIAQCYRHKRDYTKAIEYYQKLIKQFPESYKDFIAEQEIITLKKLSEEKVK